MERNAFIFDINKCVGCMACMAGCSIENGTLPGLDWRTVSGFNSLRHPGLPVFHFSMACNHCLDAPCMHNCPALAYSRDDITGAIIHHAESCIGCRYCTWTCPYDAPKFNSFKKIVEKCDFCTRRLESGRLPACVDACPVGALRFGREALSEEELLVPGFADMGIRPSIRLVPLRDQSPQAEIWNEDGLDTPAESLKGMINPPPSKIEPEKEWTLALFTLVAAFLTGWMGARLTHGTRLETSWFVMAGITGMLLSLAHLGKKARAWRSVLNIRRSWLSREIFFYMAFLATGTACLLWSQPVMEALAALTGILLLLSADLVYRFVERREHLAMHSSSVMLTGLLAYSLISMELILFIIFMLIKLGLYLYRKTIYIRQGSPFFPALSVIRILALILPVISWPAGATSPGWLILCVVLAGELLDRMEFFLEGDIPSPARTLHELTNHYIHEEKNG